MGVLVPQSAGSVNSSKGANCNEWASYEPEGTSATAKLCHGGWFNGDQYDPCPKKLACKIATERRTLNDGSVRRLPVLNPVSGVRTLQPQRIEVPAIRQPDLSRIATSIPQRTQTQQHYEAQYPQPVIPPPEYPKAMRTPYASATPVYQGGVSPTFLPRDNEEVFGRLGKNMLQGVLAGIGWHIYDYSRSVDLFG
jgi:hypothetical protein